MIPISSPSSRAIVDATSNASCSMRGSLVTNAPSSAKKTSGTVCGPAAAGTLKSKPATSASAASCIAPSASSDRTGPALSPCTTPPLLPTPVVRPAPVSMRLIAASCSAITTADTAGRTPARRSTASCVVLQMDSKNPQKSTNPR